MTRYERIAKRAVAQRLQQCTETCIPLFQLSYVADEAARQAGKVRDLYESLYTYQRLLPKGAQVGWHNDFLSVATGRDPSFAFGGAVAGMFDAAVDLGPGHPPMMY